MLWLLMGSHNLSKAAWGELQKKVRLHCICTGESGDAQDCSFFEDFLNDLQICIDVSQISSSGSHF